MEIKDFLEKYGIDENDLTKAGLDWDELMSIKEDHLNSRDRLAAAAGYVAERLNTIGQVHTIKTRIKDPDHLIEKIIRKKREGSTMTIDLKTYSRMITDLVGVRALHLFKEDWHVIHDFIVHTWDLQKRPVANICEGDHEEFINRYKEKGCMIHRHPFGYRSVHYLVVFSPSRSESTMVEIQVRTILEEAWSEIDHLIRYPYGNGKKVLSPYLLFLNRLLGNADEMGSFIKLLNNNVEGNGQNSEAMSRKDIDPINYFKSDVIDLPIQYKVKELLEERVKSLEMYLASLKTIPRYENVADAFDPLKIH
ncbi:MAG: GTP pyrophosphokinase [Deltaproteobacteria bacterium]|nr:GTP pyrophosphokinase [Deltaproteobacteria bacterium]